MAAATARVAAAEAASGERSAELEASLAEATSRAEEAQRSVEAALEVRPTGSSAWVGRITPLLIKGNTRLLSPRCTGGAAGRSLAVHAPRTEQRAALNLSF